MKEQSQDTIETDIENGASEANTDNCKLLKSCTLHKRWWCKGERVNIINCPNDAGSSILQSTGNSRFVTKNGTIVNLVLLGSREHFKKLRQAIEDLELRVHSIKLKLLNRAGNGLPDATSAVAESSFDPVKAEEELARYEKEISQRLEELTFLQQNCPEMEKDEDDQRNSEDDDDDDDSNESITTDDIFGGGKEMGLSRNITSGTFSSNSDSVLHVTSDTFGQLKQLVVISHKTSEKSFRAPIPRQFFLNGVLHRENKTYEVQSIELFTDLIYIGCLGKCENLMKSQGYTWLSLLQLVLVLLPILSRWRQMTHLKNMIHHNDLIAKVYHFVYSSVVLLMGVTITYAFDASSQKNTGNLFIGLHLLGGLLIDLYLVLCGVFFMPKFRNSLLIRMVANVTYIVPYLVLLGYPANGSDDRLNLRMWIWGFGILMEHMNPIIWIGIISHIAMIFPSSRMFDNRVAINIEHLSERHCLLVLIALGEFMVYLLGADDFALGDPAVILFNVVFAFMSILSLYYVYFRAEKTSHHQHALRRNRWTGVTWGLIHVPIVTCIAVISVCYYAISKGAVNNIQQGTETSPSYTVQNLFTLAYCSLFFCFCLLEMIHLDADPEAGKRRIRPQRIRKGIRTIVKFIVGLVFLICGLTVSMSFQSWIYFSSCLCVLAAVIEEVGRIKIKKQE